MKAPLLDSSDPVTLVGGGAAREADLREAISIAPTLVAADGGARLCLSTGHAPQAVIGDMDSIDAETAARIPAARLHRIAEQNSTDFDKALRSVRAPLFLGVGFLGARVDHAMGALNRLAARPDRAVVLIDARDVVCHLPPRLALDLPAGTRVSLFPMAAVTGRSTGLRWPIGGLDFAPDARIGTSNVSEGPVALEMDGPGMLLILPRRCLTGLAGSLQRAAPWPARAG